MALQLVFLPRPEFILREFFSRIQEKKKKNQTWARENRSLKRHGCDFYPQASLAEGSETQVWALQLQQVPQRKFCQALPMGPQTPPIPPFLLRWILWALKPCWSEPDFCPQATAASPNR